MASVHATMWSPLAQSLANGAPAYAQPQHAPRTMVASNPSDGAIIFTGPDQIAARSDNGDVLAFYPHTLDYSFEHGRNLIADFSNGSIADSTPTVMVVINKKTDVSVHYPDGRSDDLGRLDDPQSGAYDRLIQSGLVDRAGIAMLMQLERHHHDMSRVRFVRADFDRSTDAMLEAAQRQDILKNYTA